MKRDGDNMVFQLTNCEYYVQLSLSLAANSIILHYR